MRSTDSLVGFARLLIAFVLLAGAAGLALAGGSGESGQPGSGDGSAEGPREPLELEVGYMPILPVAQVFVMEGEGWTSEAGLEFNLVRFQNGPAMVQALASGELDVMFFGIGPALVARGRGQEITVVASDSRPMMSVTAAIASTASPVLPCTPSIRLAMSSAACADWLASSLISLATTANPFPASPAWAASIAAFMERRLV